jgi:hypothetical protein
MASGVNTMRTNINFFIESFSKDTIIDEFASNNNVCRGISQEFKYYGRFENSNREMARGREWDQRVMAPLPRSAVFIKTMPSRGISRSS